MDGELVRSALLQIFGNGLDKVCQQGAATALPGGAGGVVCAPEGNVIPGAARARQIPVHGDIAGDDDNFICFEIFHHILLKNIQE
jgi:hypothetical protein